MSTATNVTGLLLALALAGCGSASSTAKSLSPASSQVSSHPTALAAAPSAAASAAPSVSVAAPATASAVASAVPSAVASVGASAAAPAPSSAPVVKGGGSDLQFCQAIALNLQVMEKAANNAQDPSVEQAIVAIRHLESIAPAEIKGDLKVIGDFDQSIVDALRGGKAPNFKETPALTDALRHQGAWSAAHCGH